MSNTRTTRTGASYDGETGEVHEDAAPRHGRRVLTDSERADRDRVLAERDQLRRQELAALRAIDPACETEVDPPVVWRKPVRMGGELGDLLLNLPRVTGRGNAGSRLVLAARSYDGCGPNGGEPHEHVTAFVVFRDRGGCERRTTGVAIRQTEGRAFVDALTRWLEELDAAERSA